MYFILHFKRLFDQFALSRHHRKRDLSLLPCEQASLSCLSKLQQRRCKSIQNDVICCYFVLAQCVLVLGAAY